MIFDFLTQFGAMCIPLAVVLLFFTSEKTGWVSWVLFALAVLLGFLGFWALRNAIKIGKLETERQHQEKLEEIQKWEAQMKIML